MSKIKYVTFKILISSIIGFGISLFFIESSYAISTENKDLSNILSFRIGLLSEVRMVRNEDQGISNSQSSGFILGLERGPLLLSIEASSSKSSTGYDQITFNTSRNEMYLWIDWSVLKFKYLNFYAGFGVGGGKSTVESYVLGNYSKDESSIEGIGGAALGLQLNLYKNHLAVQLEGRELMAKSYDPGPSSSFIFKIVFIGPFSGYNL